MPKIPKKILETAFYLYPNKEDAEQGRGFGGTGFLVAIPSENFPGKVSHLYAVTNWHVACRDGASVIRLNTKDGSPDIIEYGPEQWHFNPASGYDIAAAPLPYNEKIHRVTFVGQEAFVTEDEITRHDLSPGEDVFMIGRFIDHDGGPTNKPAVRFGNISVMPAPIAQMTGKKADSYCIDMHSRTGYSGSPVFVYRTIGYDLELKDSKEFKLVAPGPYYLGLLGIHFAQFPEMWEVTDKKRLETLAAQEPLITEGRYIKGLSGMTCVVPAWAILEVLNMPELKEMRKQADQMWAAKLQREGPPPEAESVVQPVDSDNPTHKEDFNHLLGAAVQKPKRDAQT